MTFQQVMFSVVFLLALLAFSVTGSPVEVRNSPITLPMSRLAFSNITDLLRNDEARLAAFEEYSTHGRRDADSPPHPIVPLSHADLGNTYSGYTVQAGIGDPFAIYDLIVDSASATTWVGARLPHVSNSGVNTEEPVAVNYRYGSFEGTIWEDDIFFTEDIVVREMRFGVASNMGGVNADGVLGIGPTLTGLGALQDDPEQTIPTVIDCLLEQGAIRRPVVGIFFQPITANAAVNHGELTIGGTNPKMYDYLKYTDITTTAPSSLYWGINQRITYGNTLILDYTAGIVDCGSTFLYLAVDAYERYKAVTGGILNPANGFLQISPQRYDRLLDLEIHIGDSNWKLIPNAQIWPRSLNEKIEGGANDIFLIVKALKTRSGAGYDFINGYVFIQRFYTVFDGAKRRVGFGPNMFTYALTN
ncbi:acid protease [Suillus decipiens]|nr:acid protease [Suillus decipiens]